MQLIAAPNRSEWIRFVMGPKYRFRNRDRIISYKKMRSLKHLRSILANILVANRQIGTTHTYKENGPSKLIFMVPIYSFLNINYVEVTYCLRTNKLLYAICHFGKVRYRLILHPKITDKTAQEGGQDVTRQHTISVRKSGRKHQEAYEFWTGDKQK